MAADTATARPVVLRQSGAVLAAMTSGFDTSAPNMARVYDYWLGGKDHYAADRAEADRMLAIYPPLRDLVRENRAFLSQAVTWVARQGIGQFADLGAGLPTSPAIHQAARAVLPAAHVAYVDIDPVVLSHTRALLATGDGVTAVNADLRDPAGVLAHPDLQIVIDLAEPVCIILGAVLHFLDADAARAVATGYARQMTPGSYLIISVVCHDDEALAKRLAVEYTAATWHNHTLADIGSFFAGLDLVGPGLTEAQTWRAWLPNPVLRHRGGHVLVGVARRGFLPAERQPRESVTVWAYSKMHGQLRRNRCRKRTARPVQRPERPSGRRRDGLRRAQPGPDGADW
jgi:O-methyltransferase involved in polyketide biosynthesis